MEEEGGEEGGGERGVESSSMPQPSRREEGSSLGEGEGEGGVDD